MIKRASIAVKILLFIIFSSACSGEDSNGDRKMHAQLTIYVDSPLLEKGGTVIVVSNPMPLDEWRDLPSGDNPARDDAQNEKKGDVRPGDRLFGAVASTKVTIIEFAYPEGGTFGFNLVPFRSADSRDKPSPALMTKRVLVGDGGYKNWKTGKEYLWESVSTIYVAGPDVTESDSRSASVAEAAIMNLPPAKTAYEGTIVYAPTDEQVDKLLVKLPE